MVLQMLVAKDRSTQSADLLGVLYNITLKAMLGEREYLALSFFCIAEATEGHILIDDNDIFEIGLTDVRSRLAIITREVLAVDWAKPEHRPDELVLLSGTLRSAVDCLKEYQDAETVY